MNYIKSMIIVFSLFTLTAYAQEQMNEKFPMAGRVKDGGAEVRAGDNSNFESLCVLSKASPVKILDRRYSWFKILLPKKAAIYISKDYVDLTSDEKGIGIVTATSVNLRAGPGTKYSILGQVSRPEKIYIVSEDMGWYRIEPPYGTVGWILSSQVAIVEDKEKTGDEIDSAEQEAEKGYAAQETKEKKLVPPPPAQKKEITGSSIIKIDANYPSPKGNLSISSHTKNNR